MENKQPMEIMEAVRYWNNKVAADLISMTEAQMAFDNVPLENDEPVNWVEAERLLGELEIALERFRITSEIYKAVNGWWMQ